MDAEPANTADNNGAPGKRVRLRLFDRLSLFVFALLTFTVALQFFTRYVLNDSLGWTEEIARYLLILLGFCGAVVCTRNDSHIGLEFLVRRLSPKGVFYATAFRHLMLAGFFFYCSYLAVVLADKTGSNMASIEVPKAVIYYIVSAACFASGAVATLALRNLWKTTKPNGADNGEDNSGNDSGTKP